MRACDCVRLVACALMRARVGPCAWMSARGCVRVCLCLCVRINACAHACMQACACACTWLHFATRRRTEVDDLHGGVLAHVGDEHVLRLEVAVDAVHLVHVVDGVKQRPHVAADDSLRIDLLCLAQALHQLTASRQLRHLRVGRDQARGEGIQRGMSWKNEMQTYGAGKHGQGIKKKEY
eukprot:4134738-Pleurochrysis_carterae.AAC.3